MDEIEKRKAILKTILILTACVIVPVICLLAVVVIATVISGDITTELVGTMVTIIIGALVILLSLGIISYVIYRVSLKVEKAKNIITDNEKKYLREIPEGLTPAMASALYDLTTEVFRDYTATIIELCIKGYFELEANNGSYRLIALDKDANALKPDEQYVYDCIKHNKKFDEIVFRETVFEQMEGIGLVEAVDEEDGDTREVTSGTNLLYEMSEAISLKQYRRTQAGEDMAKKCKALKNFINNYTLIKEKKIDYYKTLEEYIPYALALGEADFIEDMIKNDEKYRALIYREF